MRRAALLFSFVTVACAAPAPQADTVEVPIAVAPATAVEPAASSESSAKKEADPAPTSEPMQGATTPSNAAAATAETLFMEGRTAMQNGDLRTACEKFDASFHIDPAVGTAINLGTCLEQLQRTPEACRTYRSAKALASARAQVDRVRLVDEKLRALNCP
ncbi:MAG: hypothetical protein HOW73_23875 [Polyangiaceae bacterium]|nr:hypothetical protein [Polyangiaceae bacterium]